MARSELDVDSNEPVQQPETHGCGGASGRDVCDALARRESKRGRPADEQLAAAWAAPRTRCALLRVLHPVAVQRAPARQPLPPAVGLRPEAPRVQRELRQHMPSPCGPPPAPRPPSLRSRSASPAAALWRPAMGAFEVVQRGAAAHHWNAAGAAPLRHAAPAHRPPARLPRPPHARAQRPASFRAPQPGAAVRPRAPRPADSAAPPPGPRMPSSWLHAWRAPVPSF